VRELELDLASRGARRFELERLLEMRCRSSVLSAAAGLRGRGTQKRHVAFLLWRRL
jgi:hypothetical protein